jgi:hypothetical protein
MSTITAPAAIATALERATDHQGANPTCRAIVVPGLQEWAERCLIEGRPAQVFYIFDAEEAEVEDGADMPFDADHVSRIEIEEDDAEEDE